MIMKANTTKFFHLKIINGKKYLKVATKVIKKIVSLKNSTNYISTNDGQLQK